MACKGVCVNPQTDPANCGGCSKACATGEACQSGVCNLTCAQGMTKCGGSCVSLMGDNAHCGQCFNACSTGYYCKSGVCELQCPAGQNNCSGTCVSLQSDPTNCGTCGNACAAGWNCSGGQCVLTCQPGQLKCSNTCVDPMTDPSNCGGCGNICNKSQVCEAGQCVLWCPAPEVNCNGTCVNPTTDPDNCGACGQVCSSNHMATRTCGKSLCNGACSVGWGNCDGSKLSNGCETDLTTGSNCGSCGNVCGANQLCQGGTCVTTCSETNLAPSATASMSAGGTVVPHTATELNDGVTELADCSQYAWVTAGNSADGAWYQLQWSISRTIMSVSVDTRSGTANNACAEIGRTLGAAQIQWWNGSSWVTDGAVSGKLNDWSYTFSAPVSTTRIRLYNVYATNTQGQASNPVLYELQAIGCN